MKVTAWASVSDLVEVRISFIEKLIHLVLKGEKGRMFATEKQSTIFTALKKSGVDGIELLVSFHTSDVEIKAIQAISKRYDLPILSIHQSLNSFTHITIEEIVRLCEHAKTFSAKVIVLHANAIGTRLFDKAFIHELDVLQKSYGVKFGIENMPKSIFSLTKPYTWRGKEFSATVDDADLSITFDATHLGQVGEDICGFYQRNKNRIIDIHLSDFKKHWLNSKLLLQSGTHLALTDGDLPIKKFLMLLRDTNYSGVITMEINSNLEGLCTSARMIKETTKKH